MTSFEELKKQYDEGKFSNMIFTVYNYLDDENIINELKNATGNIYDIDDMEFMKFTINDDERVLIKTMRNPNVLKNISMLNEYINGITESRNRHTMVVPVKSMGILTAVRTK